MLFPSDVKVLYENGTLGMMSELQIGDKIQTSMKIRKLKNYYTIIILGQSHFEMLSMVNQLL